mmetsp:Transcript_20440/g.47948  ORF Transcript_20440/g.47948 Transcript_20440/m.47948 type:complete len:89 (+) Transcript_20440:167-433(+)
MQSYNELILWECDGTMRPMRNGGAVPTLWGVARQKNCTTEPLWEIDSHKFFLFHHRNENETETETENENETENKTKPKPEETHCSLFS